MCIGICNVYFHTNYFVEQKKVVLILMIVFIKKVLLNLYGSHFLILLLYMSVCRNQIIYEIFEGLSERRKCSMNEMAWEFKLHLIFNDEGEILCLRSATNMNWTFEAG